ncbi:MAG: hypothetical protein CMJ82_00835 [Planctomycetaceae bacterium]|nr:hypothetical protein [Planctomycetaceae bacterium]
MSKRYQRQRRGIILLAIISLLTMFMLIGVTYVVVSGHFKRAALSNAQSRQLGVSAQKHLDSAMYQLVRDTERAGSIARGHSLLQDKYGHFSVRAQIKQATYVAGGQILELSIVVNPQILPTPLTISSPVSGQGLAMLSLGALNGRVVTFLDGATKNISGRIIKSSPNIVPNGTNTQYNYTIRMLFPKIVGNTSIAPTSFIDKFLVINGRDFSGKGAGINLTANATRYGKLDAHALLPNRSMDPNPTLPNRIINPNSEYHLDYRRGGLNEGYDVPDYQNMAMAALINNPSDRHLEYVLPSFHRPALFNYWVNARNSGTLPYNLTWHRTLQRILMRPMPWDNPEFTGGNPRMSLRAILVDGVPGNPGDDDGNGISDLIVDNNGNGSYDPGDVIDPEELFFPGTTDNFLAIMGHTLDQLDNDGDGVVNNIEENHFPWDVDNDGDGTPDSIWVDLGLPIQTDESGRKFKPLFAILCTDMDGRLNLNAHGNQMHYLAAATNSSVITAGGNTSNYPRGLGFGPAEINLVSILPNVGQYRQLLVGIPNQTNGRYGNNRAVGAPDIDPFSFYSFNDFPINHPDQQFSSFQTITDIHGELARGINTAGNPVSEIPGVPAANLSTLSNYGLPSGNRHVIADNPYELNLVSPKATDQIFTPHELEIILRSQDTDSSFQPYPGADQAWGQAGIDDDGNGLVDDIQEALFPGSDDSFAGKINSRLFDLTNAFTRSYHQNGEANRRSVTTASFDAPTPSVQLPKNYRELPPNINHLKTYGDNGGDTATLLLRHRMLLDGQTRTLLQPYETSPVLHQYALNLLMSWSKGPDGEWGEQGVDDDGNGITDDLLDAGRHDDTRSPLLDIGIFDGQKMDVNRPFGNGMDDNGDGVVDNFIESTGVEQLWPNIFNATPIFMDHDNDGISGQAGGDPDAFLARYHYARQLYVLTMLVNERPNIDFNLNGIRDDYSGDNVSDETQYNIAQWAANAVDFRDVDAIMTPFEFDINPFNGWDVDGIIGTADDAHPERALVWGCERPELLISESIVFHDRRTEDLSNEQPLPAGDQAAQIGMGDDNSDQRLLPRSGAFFELYNPWLNPTSDATAPASGSWAPAEFYRDVTTGNFTNGIRLNQTTFNTNSNGHRSPVFRLIVVRGNDQDLDPDAFEDAFKPNANAIERAIYFTDNALVNNGNPLAAEIPTGVAARNGREQFFTTFEPRPLLGGQYAVIGSSGHYANNNRYTTFIGRSTNAQGGGGQAQLDYANTRRIELIPDPNDGVGARIHNNINPPGYGDKTNTAINANIPVVGLPINQHIFGGNTSPLSLTLTEPVGGYSQRVNAVPGLDGELEFNPPRDIPLDFANNPNLANPILNNGTTTEFSVVHLQRLANPLQPYDATTNPYRTIDTHSVDVTAFNGVENEHPDDGALSPREDFFRFHSHQRGDADVIAAGMGGQPSRNLWQSEPHSQPVPPLLPGVAPAPGNDNNHIFRHSLHITLGYLNSTYGNPRPDGTPDATTGHPFPWLQWNNRPFVSSLELMQVPYSKSSKLLFDYTFDRNVPGNSPYDDVVMPDAPLIHEYGHLLNFFESGDNTANFQRIFDFLHTPSPYAGAYTYLNPLNFGSGIGTDELHPPFNKVSNFRDPGKLNLNTVFDPAVYLGLLNGHPGPNYGEWIDSRRGYGAAGNNLVSFNPNMPSLFTNPIRPTGSGDIVPLAGLERTDVELSLLRNNQAGTTALVNSAYTDQARNAQRNSSFKYQSLQRLDNLVTGRSNVYGVWITMGYFEVMASTPTPVNPDGYQLGQEIGNDRGEIRRHRAFYMIDRSIPAAFEPGENHNVDKTVILRRYIE